MKDISTIIADMLAEGTTTSDIIAIVTEEKRKYDQKMAEEAKKKAEEKVRNEKLVDARAKLIATYLNYWQIAYNMDLTEDEATKMSAALNKTLIDDETNTKVTKKISSAIDNALDQLHETHEKSDAEILADIWEKFFPSK